MARTALTRRISDERLDQLPRLARWWARLVHPETFAVSLTPSQQERLYVKSYAVIRGAVGVIGIALPSCFILAELFFLRQGIHVRSSISAYYFTSAAPIFIGGLSTIAVLLLLYLAGQHVAEFWTSLIAGVALLGVITFPTNRPKELLPPSAFDGTTLIRCGPDVTPTPPLCTPIQMTLGEGFVASVHFIFAAIFILLLAVISFNFAWRELVFNRRVKSARLHAALGGIIVVAIILFAIFKLIGVDELAGVSTLYLVECISVYSFAVSWAIKAWQTWADVEARTPSDPAAPATDNAKRTDDSSIEPGSRDLPHRLGQPGP
jgi:hypothetical protein